METAIDVCCHVGIWVVMLPDLFIFQGVVYIGQCPPKHTLHSR